MTKDKETWGQNQRSLFNFVLYSPSVMLNSSMCILFLFAIPENRQKTNQRLAEKQRGSEVKNSQKRTSTGRSPVGRNAVGPLFSTKAGTPGGGAKKTALLPPCYRGIPGGGGEEWGAQRP